MGLEIPKNLPIGAWVVGLINIVGGALGVLGSLFLLITSIGIGAMMGSYGYGSGIGFGILSTVLAVIFLIASALSIVLGYFILQLRNWARIVVTVFAVLSLLSFPIGTIIGLVELYFLWVHEETKKAFH